MPRGGKRLNAGRKRKQPKKLPKKRLSRPSIAAFDSSAPADQAGGEATRWKPGQSGNPAGRPKSAGLSIKEWVNLFAHHELKEAELRKIARDPAIPWNKRAAANRALRTIEGPDLADFQDAVDGVADLQSLRARGINTELVKKMKVKTRTLPAADGEDPVVEVEREIELHDRSGEDFDRILDRTEGRPTQALKVEADVRYRTPDDGIRRAAEILASLRGLIGADPLKPPTNASADGRSPAE